MIGMVVTVLISVHADGGAAGNLANGKTVQVQGVLSGQVVVATELEFEADPRHPKALSLAASAAFEEKKYRAPRPARSRMRLTTARRCCPI